MILEELKKIKKELQDITRTNVQVQRHTGTNVDAKIEALKRSIEELPKKLLRRQ